ncbi:MAG: hypothetical protein CO099_12370 [Bdellovibrio sp. CG_4_9_14_3_um_filter_39_7]|nr:MAG: hypothetical protein CO099_12370 [Bdellovibrio sp. CG_4_9_14_3_um_filter_39_7]
MINRSNLLILSLALFCISCAGYRFRHHENPFSDYDIQSISIPMFVNESSLANVSAPLTREFTQVLSAYPKLKIYPGESRRGDAMLIGIIRSKPRLSELNKTTSTVFTDSQLKSSIGNRQEFYVPRTTTYQLTLQIVLIKDPTFEEMKLISNPLSQQIQKHPKIVFNQTITLDGSYDRVVKETENSDDEGLTNSTKSKANFERSVQELAKTGALKFKEVILNVF